MKQEENTLFSACHWLYVQGVRIAMRERLENAHGAAWWANGVIAAMSRQRQEAYRNFLKNRSEQVSPDDWGSLLDTPHFAAIVAHNYSTAFADAFNNSMSAFRDLQSIARARNRWAHVQQMPFPHTLTAIDTMGSVLASLQRREALDIQKMRNAFLQEISSVISVEEPEEVEDMIQAEDDIEDTYVPDEQGSPLFSSWHELRSYLTIDTEVESGANTQDETVLVTVRVSNTAPASPDLPKVRFVDVKLNVPSGSIDDRRRGRGGYNRDYGDLEPGQSFEEEFTFPRKRIIAVNFSVYGQIDLDSLFNFRQKSGLPTEVVKRVLDEFVEGFQGLEVKEFVERSLAVMSAAGSEMTMQQAAALRKEIEDIRPILGEKMQNLHHLAQVFGFNIDRGDDQSGDYSLGNECAEILRLLREFGGNLLKLDKAIGETDVDLIQQSVNGLEQQQLAIMRLENAIKEQSGD